MPIRLSFPILVLLLSVIRMLVLGASIGEAIVIAALCGLTAFDNYITSKKQPVANKDILDRIVFLEEQLKSTKESVHSMRLGGSLKK